jgi:hypothetical protein
MLSDDEARTIWLAGQEAGRREERSRIIELLDSIACTNVYCRYAKIMRAHAGCEAVRKHIELIERMTK